MTKVLITAAFTEQSVRYNTNQVVDFDDANMIATRKAASQVDDTPANVASAIAAGATQRIHKAELGRVRSINGGSFEDIGPASARTAVDVTGTAYTLAPGISYVCCKSGSATTVTVPDDNSPFAIGEIVTIEQDGAGAVAIAAAAGVTVNVISGRTAAIAGRYGIVQLIKKAANRWTLFGALA